MSKNDDDDDDLENVVFFFQISMLTWKFKKFST